MDIIVIFSLYTYTVTFSLGLALLCTWIDSTDGVTGRMGGLLHIEAVLSYDLEMK